MLWAPLPPAKQGLLDTGSSFSQLNVNAKSAEGNISELALALQIRISRANHFTAYNDGSDGCRDRASVLLSVVEENLRTKQAIYQELFGAPATAATLFHIEPPLTTPLLADELRIFEDIQTFATSTVSASSTEPFDGTNTTLSCSSTTTATEYDSDRTDFLVTVESPCPKRKAHVVRRQTGRKSHYFRASKTSHKTLPVRRRLEFRTPSVLNPRPGIKPYKMGLAPEYKPNHHWTYEEREYVYNLPRIRLDLLVANHESSCIDSFVSCGGGMQEHLWTLPASTTMCSGKNWPYPRFATNWRITCVWCTILYSLYEFSKEFTNCFSTAPTHSSCTNPCSVSRSTTLKTSMAVSEVSSKLQR
jgi:hypothetical protein